MPRGVYERKPRAKVFRPFAMCSVEGCGRDANRRGPGLCERHYYHKRRTGSPKPRAPRARQEQYSDKHGYTHVYPPQGHPLSKGTRAVLQHRLLFFDAHGAGPHPCHWCGIYVEWSKLHVDHLNDMPGDNAPANLLPSCPGCNIARARRRSRVTMRERYEHRLAFDGQEMALSEWAARLGITTTSMRIRLAKGWPLERALTEPRGRFGPKIGCNRGSRVTPTPRAAMTIARRRAVWETGGRCCGVCRKAIPLRGGTIVDHIVPLEFGGQDAPPNLQMLCTPCDRIKTANDIERIAKMRRQQDMSLDCEPRAAKRPLRSHADGPDAKLQSKVRGQEKLTRAKVRKPGGLTHPTLKKRMDGSVVRR